MEEAAQETIKYLYQPSIALEVFILLVIICSFSKPKIMTAVMAALLLLRPNERFECFVSYPKIIFPVLALSLIFFSDKESRSKQIGFDKPLLYFMAFIAIQTVAFHSQDIAQNVEILLVGLLFYYAMNLFSKDQDGVKLLSYMIIFSCFIITGEAVYYHFTEPPGSTIWNLFHKGNAGRLQAWGNWSNANETAFIACIGIANATFLCVRFKAKVMYVASSVLIPFLTFVVLLTGSRAGLATLVLIFMPMAVLFGSNISKVAVMTAIVGGIFMSSSLAPHRVDQDASREDRFDLRYRAIQLVKQYPLAGVGFQRAKNDLGGMSVHNTYVQALAETGVLVAPFLFYFLYKIWVRVYRAFINFRNNGLSKKNAAIVAGQYLGCLFYFFWGNQLLSVLFFLVLAQINIWTQLIEVDNSAALVENSQVEA